ncbi:MAG: HAD-IA family hydrolase, partial [archaeon]
SYYNEIAFRLYKHKVDLNPRIIETMTFLKENGIKLSICSSSPKSWVDIVIKRFNLDKLIDIIITSDDTDGKSKPSPQIYLNCLKKLNLNNKEVIAVEDSKNGIKSANNANIYCIGYYNGFNIEKDLNLAKLIISDLTKLKDLNKLNSLL